MANYCYNNITISGPTETVEAIHQAMVNAPANTAEQIAVGWSDPWNVSLIELVNARHDDGCDVEGHPTLEGLDAVHPFDSEFSLSRAGSTSTIHIECHTKWNPFHDLFEALACFYPALTIEVWGEEFGSAGAWRFRWVDGEHTECDSAELLNARPAPKGEDGYMIVLRWKDSGVIERRYVDEPKSEMLRVHLLGVARGEFDPEGTLISILW